MKLICKHKRPITVLLALCFIISLAHFSGISAFAGTTLSSEEEKAALEQRIKETNNKIDELEAQSSDTEEYRNALSTKIGYLEQQLNLISDEVESDKVSVNELNDKCKENEKQIKSSESEINDLTQKLDAATETFNDNYHLYCKRIRAMYISGETNVIAFLLTSEDISDFLTRYEMIRRISKQDGELLKKVDSEMKSITASKKEITEKREKLTKQQQQLLQMKTSLESSMTNLQSKQTELDNKKATLSTERAQANVRLKQISDETGYYTEFLENDQKMLQEIDDEIAAAEKKYSKETTTAATTETTEKKEAEDQSDSDDGENKSSKSTKEQSSKYISLIYPVPSQKKITCGFHGYSGHSGADFSCPTGSKVVAAESGTVIISKDLKNPDGSYKSYGRYIVIMHDKTTSSGNKVYTLYAHNSKRLVSEGQHVNKGQQISESGSTGNSTGPHLHFEVRTPTSAYSSCKNPANYLP